MIRVRERGPWAWSDGWGNWGPGYVRGPAEAASDRRESGLRVRHPGGQHDRADDRKHDQTEHQQPQHRPGAAAVLGQRFEAEKLIDDVGKQPGHDRRGGGDKDRAHHFQVDQAAAWRLQVGAQQDIADDRACEEADPVGEAEVSRDQLTIIGEVGRGQRRGDLHRGDDDDHDDRRPRLFAGVEDPKLQQHQRVGDEGERRQRDRHAQIARIDVAEVPVREQRAADGRARDGHEGHDRDQRHHRQPRRKGQIGQHRPVVVGRGVAAQPRHHHSQHRHADHPEREHQHQPRVGVDGGPRRRSLAGDLVPDDKPDLTDQHVEDHRRRHPAEPAQPVVETPQRSQADPLLADRDKQDGGLGEDTERGADAEHEQLGVAHFDGVD